MPSKYKMTYFNGVRSRSEIPRLVFAAAKKEYEFKGIDFPAWPEFKPKTPYGGLPILEVDGKVHGQGMAIAVFLAMEFGLMGKNNMDHFRIEQLLHLREDLIGAEAKQFLEQDATKKAELAKVLMEETYPKFLKMFSAALKQGGRLFLGDKMSLGDLILYGALTTPLKTCPAVVEKFPDLIAHRKIVDADDGIKKFVASFPDTPI